MMLCPFCKCDPYEYVDRIPVAVTCCDLGIGLFDRRGPQSEQRFAVRVLCLMRSHSPRRKARAMRLLRDHGVRE